MRFGTEMGKREQEKEPDLSKFFQSSFNWLVRHLGLEESAFLRVGLDTHHTRDWLLAFFVFLPLRGLLVLTMTPCQFSERGKKS